MANNYKVKMVDLQNKYKFKIFCSSQMYDDTELKRELDTLYKAFPKASGTGTDATLNGTAAAIMNIDLKGNTSQETTTGKNLLGIPDGTYTDNGITAVISNGKITLNGTASETSFIILNLLNSIELSNQTVTISANNSVAGGDSLTEIRVYTSGSAFMACQYNTIDSNITYTNKTDTYTRFQIRTSSGVTYNNFVLYPQLEKGSSATSYEPYTNGASPNPYYPQDIHVVSGDNTIEVCGVNIWDEEWEQGYINATGDYKSSTVAIRTKNYVPVRPNTEYYIYNGTESTGRWTYYDKNMNWLGTETGANTSKTTPSNCYYIKYSTGTSYGGTYSNNICINVSNTSINGTYYPYNGDTYELDLGVKNLLQNTATTQTISGITFTKNEDGSVLVNGTATATINTYKIATISLGAGTYTLSGCPSGGSTSTYRLVETNAFFDDRGSGSTKEVSTTTSYSFYVQIYNGTTLNNVLFKPQLEKGSKVNSFTPYGTTPIELCKIGDYQDYIYKEGKKWYLHKEIGNYIFTGNEEWLISGNDYENDYPYFLTSELDNVINTSSSVGYMNYFKPLSAYTTQDNGFLVLTNNRHTRIKIYKGNLQDVSSLNATINSFKDWLSTHNTMFYYALATPTTTEIIDATLISQLNALRNAESYEGQTNISQVNDKEAFIITASAIKDLSNL